MTSMVERVARALCQQEGHNPDGPSSWFNDAKLWMEWVDPARAAIEAMREPTPEMIEAGRHSVSETFDGYSTYGYIDADDAETNWRAMIEAALVDKI